MGAAAPVVGNVHDLPSGRSRGCGARGRANANAARGRGRGRTRRRDQCDMLQDDQDIVGAPLKRGRVAMHAGMQINSIVDAALAPVLAADAAAHATIGRSAVDSILEPSHSTAADEVERRRAKMTQAILEPDAMGNVGMATSIAADIVFDPDALRSQPPLQDVPLSQPQSLHQPSPAAAPFKEACSSSQRLAPASASAIRNPASLGLFDPLSSDDEAPPKRVATPASVPAVSLAQASKAAPSDGASPASGSTVPGHPSPANSSQLIIGESAAQSRVKSFGDDLFFSDDEA